MTNRIATTTIYVSLLQRAIIRGLGDRARASNTGNKERFTSMFCIAYCTWANIKARLTPDEQKQYIRDGYSSVSWDMPTLAEIRQFAEEEAQQALEDEQAFVPIGLTIDEVNANRPLGIPDFIGVHPDLLERIAAETGGLI